MLSYEVNRVNEGSGGRVTVEARTENEGIVRRLELDFPKNTAPIEFHEGDTITVKVNGVDL